jgi:hypothetical protein
MGHDVLKWAKASLTECWLLVCQMSYERCCQDHAHTSLLIPTGVHGKQENTHTHSLLMSNGVHAQT